MTPPQSDDKTIVNYPDIRESLALILAEEAPTKHEAILASLDDALGNNADHLTLVDDLPQGPDDESRQTPTPSVSPDGDWYEIALTSLRTGDLFKHPSSGEVYMYLDGQQVCDMHAFIIAYADPETGVYEGIYESHDSHTLDAARVTCRACDDRVAHGDFRTAYRDARIIEGPICDDCRLPKKTRTRLRNCRRRGHLEDIGGDTLFVFQEQTRESITDHRTFKYGDTYHLISGETGAHYDTVTYDDLADISAEWAAQYDPPDQ